MRNLATIAAVTLALTSCGKSAFEVQVQEVLRFKLTDPQSAQFTDDWYDETHDIACGAVNARNQFGGYVGKRLWVWKDATAYHQPDFGTAEFVAFNRLWDECQKAHFPDHAAPEKRPD